MMHVHVHIMCTFYTPTVYHAYTIIPNLQKVPETPQENFHKICSETLYNHRLPSLSHPFAPPLMKITQTLSTKNLCRCSSHMMHCSISGFHTGLLVEGGEFVGHCRSIVHEHTAHMG